MTRTEFAGLFKKLQHAYSFLRYDSTDMMETWYEIFKDSAYAEMAAAVQDWLLTQPKEPTPAALLEHSKHYREIRVSRAKEEARKKSTGCPKCNGYGIYFIRYPHGQDYAYRCTCAIGRMMTGIPTDEHAPMDGDTIQYLYGVKPDVFMKSQLVEEQISGFPDSSGELSVYERKLVC